MPAKEKRTCPCKKLPLTLSSFTAAEYGDLHTLSTKAGQQTDAGGYTPLHLAAQNGHTSATALLLQRGAADYTQNGATPLHRASFSGAICTMKLLLNAGANLIAKDASFGDFKTPLHKAVSGGRHLAVTLLLQTAMAENCLSQALEARDAAGLTPLQVAQEMRGRNYQEEHDSVKRWDVVATCTPDWNQCVALLEEQQDENDSVSKKSRALEPVPKHLSDAQLDCLDCDTEDGRCLTASWEAAFRSVLASSCVIVTTKNRPRLSIPSMGTKTATTTAVLSDAQEESSMEEKEPPAAPKGKQCAICSVETFAFFRVGGKLVCKSCSQKARKLRYVYNPTAAVGV